MKVFLNSGEFARLCHTTKDTLLHYDRKGLFHPSFVSENGYRRYSIEQYFEFDLIALLRSTGSSLDDVKLFQEQKDVRERLTMLRERATSLDRERRLLARRENKLRRLIKLAEEALDSEYDVIHFEERTAEYVRIFPVMPEKMVSSTGSVEAYSASLTSGDPYGCGHLEAPLGVLVPEESVLAGECQMSYLFFSSSKEFEGEKIEMPAGVYASMFHNDIVTGHISKFSQLVEELRQTGWRACGHACMFDQMSGFLQGSGYSYLAKYMVRVERG